MTNAQRDTIGANLLKLQFQFNQGKDYSGAYTEGISALRQDLAVRLLGRRRRVHHGRVHEHHALALERLTGQGVPAECGGRQPARPATNAAKFAPRSLRSTPTGRRLSSRAITSSLPSRSNAITSEAMGYGMMIAAAMGDKTAFDKFYGYVNTQLAAAA